MAGQKGHAMRSVVIGLGVQGEKRRQFAGADYVASVDPIKDGADYRCIKDVPLNAYDLALCCTPDASKLDIINYLISNGKHVLVEKPLWAQDDAELEELAAQARRSGVLVYTAYNHRFEPHFVRMKEVINSGVLGEIYHCRMFYGNGTARLVRDSVWRDQHSGVLHDLGSHLLDTCRFWFGNLNEEFEILFANAYENRALDHVVFGSPGHRPRIELEMTFLMWRNHFTCDIFAEKGTAHISSLCKWGPSSFTLRTRVMPSGRPPEQTVTIVQPDPTWELEYSYVKQLIANGAKTDLSGDIVLNNLLRRLSRNAIARAKP